jgi:4-carboxymuconolactone decarboxylase
MVLAARRGGDAPAIHRRCTMARTKTPSKPAKPRGKTATTQWPDTALFREGLSIRREVLGDAYVDKALAGADDFNRPLQELVTEYCWGAVWGRPGLPRKTRSLLNLAMLSALNRPHEIEAHTRGALRNGCTPAEISEVLLQAAIYCGVPAAVDSFRVARAVLAEEGAKKPAAKPARAKKPAAKAARATRTRKI